jgi:hypothetical protein
VLSPFDDYPIHPSADPIAHPATGDPNHYVVEPIEHGIERDLTFRARTVAVEEPRQRRVPPVGILTMDHTRLTQWGTWQRSISVDGADLRIDPSDVAGTRDRSWGMRPAGQQRQTNRPRQGVHAFWLWAPLHFGDRFMHLASAARERGWFALARVGARARPDARQGGALEHRRRARVPRHQVRARTGAFRSARADRSHRCPRWIRQRELTRRHG